VIKVDPRNYVGLKNEAYDKAQTIRERAAKGEDFATLAKTKNDDRGLAASGGYVVADGWVSEGAYAVDEVDKAVFRKMRPGEVSDLITGPDGSFYVVKLEEIKPGAVRPFADFEVQQEIRRKLEAQQFEVLRNKHVEDLKKDAVIRPNQETYKDAMEMILRRYPQWAAAK
jgi:parvulin-like peptidyl-prolyl isomerase